MTLTKVVVLDNPYLGYLLSILRSKHTPRDIFRTVMEEAATYIAYEVCRELPTKSIDVETPLGVAHGVEIDDRRVVVIAILRAGIPMLNGVLRVLKRARVGFITARRIESEARGLEFEVETHYVSLPQIDRDDVVIVVDPMLATASTMCKIMKMVAMHSPRKILILNIIAAKQGVENLNKCTQRIEVPIELYTLAIDPVLNDRGFIVPGLGDAGDRAFTK